MFFRKKSYVRFYSNYPGVRESYPVKKAKDHKHSWLESMNKDFVKEVEENHKSKCPFGFMLSTSKCPAIRDITRRGYIVYAPCDIKIVTEKTDEGEDIKWSASYDFSDVPGMGPVIILHHPNSLLGLIDHRPDTMEYVLKINLPWRVECSDDVVLLQSHVHYSSEGRFTTASGVLDPKESNQINVQLFWHITNGVEVIKAGTPLAQYIPIKRSFTPDFIVDDETEKDLLNERKLHYIHHHSTVLNHKMLRNFSEGRD